MTMLDQYEGVLTYKVDFNDEFAQATCIDAQGENPKSIDDEFWLGTEMQIHPEYLGMDYEEFKDAYPEDSIFTVELRIKVLSKGTLVAAA